MLRGLEIKFYKANGVLRYALHESFTMDGEKWISAQQRYSHAPVSHVIPGLKHQGWQFVVAWDAITFMPEQEVLGYINKVIGEIK
jgi:hypothetical protein